MLQPSTIDVRRSSCAIEALCNARWFGKASATERGRVVLRCAGWLQWFVHVRIRCDFDRISLGRFPTHSCGICTGYVHYPTRLMQSARRGSWWAAERMHRSHGPFHMTYTCATTWCHIIAAIDSKVKSKTGCCQILRFAVGYLRKCFRGRIRQHSQLFLYRETWLWTTVQIVLPLSHIVTVYIVQHPSNTCGLSITLTCVTPSCRSSRMNNQYGNDYKLHDVKCRFVTKIHRRPETHIPDACLGR